MCCSHINKIVYCTNVTSIHIYNWHTSALWKWLHECYYDIVNYNSLLQHTLIKVEHAVYNVIKKKRRNYSTNHPQLKWYKRVTCVYKGKKHAWHQTMYIHLCKTNAPHAHTYPYEVSATKWSSLQPLVP